jgi:Tfp pilus assembly protein PilN
MSLHGEGSLSTAAVGILLTIGGAVLVDRVYIGVQLENARTRIMTLEQTQAEQNGIIMLIRDRQTKNEDRITRLEEEIKRR